MSQPLLAQFTQPWMLFWAAAAAAPILIHLLNRRRYREQSWAAMEYLLAAMRKNVRRIQIEQWLLLALRTLLILLLVAAVADPVIQGLGLSHIAGVRTHRVFVLDASYSMAYRDDQSTRFAQAKRLIARIVEESPQGDAFTLVLMGAPAKAVVATPSFARNEFLEELNALELPHGGADVAAGLAKAAELLQAARRDEGKLQRDEVILVSDLCGPSWSARHRALGQAARDQAEALVSEGASLVVMDVGGADAENISITDLTTPDRLAAVGRELRFEAQLANRGRRDRLGQRVEFLVDGARVGARTVDVRAGSTATAPFRFRFDTPGDHVIEARAAGDKLDPDNARWLSLTVRDRVRVLCVDGDPGGADQPGAADYVRLALAPRDADRAGRFVEVEATTEAGWLEHDLTRFDAVFLCDVRQFTAAEAKALQIYVGQGGGLVTFLGPNIDPASYNTMLRGENTPRLLPAALGDIVTDNSQPVDPLGYRHPIVRLFRDQEQAGLLTTPIHRYFRLEPDLERGAQVVAALAGGDSWIVSGPAGRGVSILVATSASNRDWTLLPIWPSFVPLVQEMLVAALQGDRVERNVIVGDAIGGALGGLVADVPVRVVDPRQKEHVVTAASHDGQAQWSFADTALSGVYTAGWNAPTTVSTSFAVNVDPAEGDLTRLSERQLREAWWPGVAFLYASDWQAADAAPGATFNRATPLHYGLLLAALGVMLAESTLAWYSGARAA